MTRVLIQIENSGLPDFYLGRSAFGTLCGKTIDEVKAKALPMLLDVKAAQDASAAVGDTRFTATQPHLQEPIEVEWICGL